MFLVPPDQGPDVAATDNALAVFGRGPLIDVALRALRAGRDVVLEGEAGMGRASTRMTIAALAKREGVSVHDLRANGDASGDGDIVTCDVSDVATEALHAAIATRRPGVSFLLSQPPILPFESATADVGDRLNHPLVLTLGPLSAAECEALIDEQVQLGNVASAPSPLERRSILLSSGGYPTLALELLADVDEPVDDLGGVASLSRRSVVAATAIVNALAPQLRRLAIKLASLVGVSVSRLRGPFDPVELAMLSETNIITERRGHLVIPPPVQGALRLLDERDRLSGATREVILDIATSLTIEAECSAHEVLLAASALSTDEQLREQMSPSTQARLLSAAMWLSRRRGDIDTAARIARKLMRPSESPNPELELFRIAARNEQDDYAAYEQLLADAPSQTHLPMWNWALCLQLPFLHTAPGARDLHVRLSERSSTADQRRFAVLLETMDAAAHLESGRYDEALTTARRVADDPTADPVPVLRALAIEIAVHAWRLDGAELLATTGRLVEQIRRLDKRRGIEADLARQSAFDALLHVSVSFGAAMTTPPETLCTVISDLTDAALALDDETALIRLVLARICLLAVSGNSIEIRDTFRLLRRFRSCPLASWALSRFDGPMPDRSEEHPIFDAPFTTHASNALRVLVAWRSGDLIALTAHAHSIETFSPLGRVVSRFVRTLTDEVQALPDAASMPRPAPGSVPHAMLQYCDGAAAGDSALLASAARTFAEYGIFHAAQVAAQSAQCAAGDDDALVREARTLQRTITAQSRALTSDSADLTPREREIAVLASQGLRNRDIAARLFLSVRTVESHLYRAMRKLAVTRDALASSLVGHAMD